MLRLSVVGARFLADSYKHRNHGWVFNADRMLGVGWGVASGVQTGRHEPSYDWGVVNSMHASYGLASDAATITGKRLRTRPKCLAFLSNNHRGLMHLQRTMPLPHIGQLSVIHHPICSLSHFVIVIETNSTALNNFFPSARTHDYPGCGCSINFLLGRWRMRVVLRKTCSGTWKYAFPNTP